MKAPRWNEEALGRLVSREAFQARVEELRALGSYDAEPEPVRLSNGRLLVSAATLTDRVVRP